MSSGNLGEFNLKINQYYRSAGIFINQSDRVLICTLTKYTIGVMTLDTIVLFDLIEIQFTDMTYIVMLHAFHFNSSNVKLNQKIRIIF
jgi:hypothetical protein